MSSTELTVQTADELSTQMDFARMVTAIPDRGSGTSILPDSYKGNPANVLIAVGLGRAMGLSPAESLYRISVIKGKPSAGAELIAANVRKAGHKLRVKVSEDPPSATCTIVRADDPDEPTVVTRDMAWAQRMGLAGEHNYKTQPATMLSWRAITACARLACPEALYGVAYTPDEVADMPDERPSPARPTAAQFLEPGPASQPVDAEVVEQDAGPQAEPMTTRSRNYMFKLFSELGIDEADQRAGIAHVVGRPIESRGDLTEDEARRVIERLKLRKAEQEAGAQHVDDAFPEPDAESEEEA